jgi:cell division protein FtsB
VWHLRYLKYVVVVVIGIAVVGFVGENSVMAHLRNKLRIGELQEEIDRYMTQYKQDQNRIRELNTDPKAMEKIARERYFMKTDDEDIFVLSTDAEEYAEEEIPEHETTE